MTENDALAKLSEHLAHAREKHETIGGRDEAMAKIRAVTDKAGMAAGEHGRTQSPDVFCRRLMQVAAVAIRTAVDLQLWHPEALTAADENADHGHRAPGDD